MSDIVKHEMSIPDQVKQAVASGLLPREMTMEKAIVIAKYGVELGLSPIVALKEMYVVNGRACMSSSLMKAQVHSRMPKALFKIVESTAERCTIKTRRDAYNALEPESVWTYTMEEAKAAGITNKDPWKKYPADMLRNRCMSRAARGEFPDIFMGAVYAEGEIDDSLVETTDRLKLKGAETIAPTIEILDAEVTERISKDQADKLRNHIVAAGVDREMVLVMLKPFGVEKIAELKPSDYKTACLSFGMKD